MMKKFYYRFSRVIFILVAIPLWLLLRQRIKYALSDAMPELPFLLLNDASNIGIDHEPVLENEPRSFGFPTGKIYTKEDVVPHGEIFPKSAKPPLTIHLPFLIENQHLCAQYKSVKYVILVHSSATNFEFRGRLRNTWAKANLFSGINSVTIFVLGKNSSEAIMDKVSEENKEFGDIIIGDFIDSYANITLKATMGMKWLYENCRNAEYVIKADDDTFINIFRLKHVFTMLDANPKQLICSVIDHPPIVRGEESYLYIPPDYFKGFENYPVPICFGYAVFYKFNLVVELFELAKVTPFFKLDDVYFYGIIASKIEGLTWRHGRRFIIKVEWSPEFFSWYPPNQMLVGSTKSTKVMYEMWNTILTKTKRNNPSRDIYTW